MLENIIGWQRSIGFFIISHDHKKLDNHNLTTVVER
jgi:hypothetical protein